MRLNFGIRGQMDKGRIFTDCIFVPRWRMLKSMGGVEERGEMDPQVKRMGVVSQIGDIGLSSNSHKRRVLELFSGTGSVGNEFVLHGFEVVSVDVDPKCEPTHTVDVLEWDYKSAYPPRWFDIIFASPPCDQFSHAKTRGKKRDMTKSDLMVQRVLEMVAYFKPEKWFLENPRLGLLKTRPYMKDIPYVDVDYCQFSDWGYQKPTRIWGGEHVKLLEARLCDMQTCQNVVFRPNGARGHKEVLGGNHMRFSRWQKYRIPELLVRYLCELPDPEVVANMVECLDKMQLSALPEVRFSGDYDEELLRDVAMELIKLDGEEDEFMVQSVVGLGGGLPGEEVERCRQSLLHDYADTVFTSVTPKERSIGDILMRRPLN